MATITRPALRYYGGKWRMAEWIISRFPAHEIYIEPCFGAGSILLKKRRVSVETVNDLHGDVVNFFRTLRDKREELVEKIRLTPWAREEAQQAIEGDDVERARRFWAVCWMAIANERTKRSFRVTKNRSAGPAKIMLEVDYLYAVAERLQGVQIDQMDALEFIERYDNEKALIYFDPPYMAETRSHAEQYAHEIDDAYHRRAAAVLNKCKARVVVSGYDCPLYDEIYTARGWRRFDKECLTNSQQTRIESLWLSSNCEMSQVNFE